MGFGQPFPANCVWRFPQYFDSEHQKRCFKTLLLSHFRQKKFSACDQHMKDILRKQIQIHRDKEKINIAKGTTDPRVEFILPK